jgi:hypothetical protein
MSVPIVAAFTEAGIFAAAGVVNLSGMRWARRVYDRWDISAAIYRTLGVVELVAAVLLVSPETRLLGVVIAAPIIFGSVVMLLEHRHYLYAMPAMALMALLLVTMLAVPYSRHSVRYAVLTTHAIAAPTHQVPARS